MGRAGFFEVPESLRGRKLWPESLWASSRYGEVQGRGPWGWGLLWNGVKTLERSGCWVLKSPRKKAGPGSGESPWEARAGAFPMWGGGRRRCEMIWGKWGSPQDLEPQGTGDLTRWWDRHSPGGTEGRDPPPTGCGRRGDVVTLPENPVSAQGGHEATCKRRAKSSREGDGHRRRVCKGNLSTNIY